MATTSEAASRRSRFSPKLLVALAAGASLCLGGALVYIIRPGLVQAASSAPAQQHKPIFVAMEPLTVNLQSDSKGRFLHIGVSLKVRDEQAQAQVAESLPELRSRLLLLLSDRQPDTLATPADKARLAEQIRDELNRPLAAGSAAHGITGVSFSAFVVQ